MKCLILSAVLLALATRDACALAEPYNGCVRFFTESGEELRKVCRQPATKRTKNSGPAAPDGRNWDWVEEVTQPAIIHISDTRSYAVVAENFIRSLAGGRGGSNMNMSVPDLPGGYRLFCYGEEGNLLWQKTVSTGRFVQGIRFSADNSLAVVITGSNVPDAPPEQVSAYDLQGRRLLTFPEKAGSCSLSTPGDLWLSKNGDFMMVPCARSRPFFFQPKSGKVWRADKRYHMLRDVQSSSSDPLEETPGEGLVTYELGGASTVEAGDNTLNLYAVPWRSLGKVR